jgi:Icc protein
LETREQQPLRIQPARADTACVVQITDTHISAEPGPQFDGVDTTATLSAVLDAIRARRRQPDLVLLTGDLVDEPSVAAYGRLREQLARLPFPVACLPGNHDDPAMLRAEMRGQNVSTPGIADIDGWRIVLLDDWIPGSSGGRLCTGELERLEAALRDGRGSAVLVAVHHPPVSVASSWMDAMGMENPEELFAVLDRFANVRALVCGHIHQIFESRRDEVVLLGTPSTCVQFQPGATDYLIDRRAPGYRELLLRPDGDFASRVVRVPA